MPWVPSLFEDCHYCSVNGGIGWGEHGGISEGDHVMRILQRRPAGTDASDIAMDAAKHFKGSHVTTVVSAVARLFSGFSLWETSSSSVESR